MPKLPPLSPQKVIAILEKKSFVLKKVTGSHYIFANAKTKRRVTVPFHSSQGGAKGTRLQILKDEGISREEVQVLL